MALTSDKIQILNEAQALGKQWEELMAKMRSLAAKYSDGFYGPASGHENEILDADLDEFGLPGVDANAVSLQMQGFNAVTAIYEDGENASAIDDATLLSYGRLGWQKNNYWRG